MSTIRQLIDRIRSIPGMGKRVAARAAPYVEEALRANVASGLSPDGSPWKPKKDGGQALKNAAKKITARADGAAIVVTLSGKAEVIHNRGTKKDPKRKQIPSKNEVPKIIADAVLRAANEDFQAHAVGR